jgi:hypothetical protein
VKCRGECRILQQVAGVTYRRELDLPDRKLSHGPVAWIHLCHESARLWPLQHVVACNAPSSPSWQEAKAATSLVQGDMFCLAQSAPFSRA